MTRDEIMDAYDVDSNGIIQSLGRFEGAPVYTPALWVIVLDGCADEALDRPDGSVLDLIEVDDELRAEWPEIGAETAWIALEQSDCGFVFTTELTAAEYEQLIACNESECSDAEEPNEDESE